MEAGTSRWGRALDPWEWNPAIVGPWHASSHCVMSRRDSHHATCPVVSSPSLSCPLWTWPILFVLPYLVIQCGHTMPLHGIPYCAMPFHVIAMSYRAIPWHTMPYHVAIHLKRIVSNHIQYILHVQLSGVLWAHVCIICVPKTWHVLHITYKTNIAITSHLAVNQTCLEKTCLEKTCTNE